jgi:hypothetical protein
VGDQVLARVHASGRGKDSGVRIDWDFGVFFSDFRDGQGTDARAFMDWDSARRAAGTAAG